MNHVVGAIRRASGIPRDAFKTYWAHNAESLACGTWNPILFVQRCADKMGFHVSLKLMHTEQLIHQDIDYFLALPNNKDLAKFRILPHVWDALQDVEEVLSVSWK
jgi:hypothetical protein